MYQPTLGRFLSRDPLSENGVDVLTDTGFYSDRLAAMNADPWYYGGNWENPYVYARNNPVNLVDPSGLWALHCRRLAGVVWATFQIHCWVECAGTTYSLLNKNGTATPVINDPADKGKGWIEAFGSGRCDCIAANFKGESGTYQYSKDDCNSNWYAHSLLRSCDLEVPRPSRAYGWDHCKRYKFKQTVPYKPDCPAV